MFDFLRSCLSAFHRGCSILHSHQQCKRVPVSSHSPPILGFDCVCEMVSHGSFDLHSLDDVVHFCMCLLVISISFLGYKAIEKTRRQYHPAFSIALQ